MKLSDVSILVEDAERRIIALEDESDGWTKVKENSECLIVSRPSEDFSGLIYKSTGVISAAPDQVFRLLMPEHDQPGRSKWDSTIVSSVILEQISPDTHIRLTKTSPVLMGLISAREFIDLIKVIRQPHRLFTVSVSPADHPLAPMSKGFVRGTNYPSGLFCYSVDGKPNETMLVQYIHSDPGGLIPQSLLDTATPQVLTNSYKQLKSALKKQKI